jgi:hypothetical protein
MAPAQCGVREPGRINPYRFISYCGVVLRDGGFGGGGVCTKGALPVNLGSRLNG